MSSADPTPAKDVLSEATPAIDNESKRALRNMAAVVCLVSIAPFTLNLLGFDFASAKPPLDFDGFSELPKAQAVDATFEAISGSFTHTILEWTASALAMFTVVLAFVHFRIKRDVVTPIIGIALFSAGCMDAFHTLAADRLITATAANKDLIPFTWAICRSFNAVIPLTAFAMVLFSRKYAKDSHARTSFIGVIAASVVMGAISYGLISYCATSPSLPKTMFPDALITRPWDVFPLVIYALSAFVIYPMFARKTQSLFSQALWLSVIPDFATQVHMAFGSTALFDNHFNIAHFLKIIAYLVPCLGLVLDYVRSYRDELRAVESAAIAYERLEKANTELEAVNSRLTTQASRLETQAIELERSNEELEGTNRELREFAYVASHDLQEPLRKIQSFGDRLVSRYSDDLPDRARHYVGRMHNAADRMSRLIEDLLSFSRTTNQELVLKSLNLTDVVAAAVDNLEVAIERRGASVNVGELPVIDGDEAQLMRLFQNLIGNGLKFDRDGVWPIVTVSAEVTGDECVVSVADNGIGFEQQYADKIFTVFQRLHGRNEYEGTGVGLAVCRRVAEKHHGSIKAVGEPGVGATFIVTLPLRADRAKRTPDDGSAEHQEAA